jgi:hypothetical protein
LYCINTNIRYFYYLAIISNTLFRFTWILKATTISHPNQSLDTFLIGGEMFRRFIWVFLRLEREWVVIHPDVLIAQEQYRVDLHDTVKHALVED